ncbi:hybrid-cluster NAD(P)-dependent oxidoreductase [Allorhizobium sp. BGMRC 0089]|uniref:hybrid-cluster NAD(P)-dependent oxidoreductase n=1 Tax=Allorhizobium sonneratiae TaxID=2934936 RepID=UPI00203471DA|nr:hybrid-cluster NAD(P)-dependent oxidoreductase [Allorhizobium sonneratiae]MCM2294544.1 hybrid-cluster NAD(P)-dependent oxidoreductase [Allorhizobium sonneratiae]
MAKDRHYRHVDELKPWSDREHMLECVAWTPEAPDVMTFTFKPDRPGLWFRYRPGQFVTLELPVGPEPVLRTYTLSSSPSRPYTVAVTVKAQKGSIGTRWMFENLKPGMKIRAIGPLGDFSYVNHPGEKYLFISAGSGITPMMSMSRDMADREPDSDVNFIHCARSPDDIIFRWELEYKARYLPYFQTGFIVEEVKRSQLWTGLRGFIDKAKIALLAPDFLERTVFCCGPEPFMATVRESLEGAGFDMSRYHEETFQPVAPQLPVAVAETSGEAKPFTVSFSQAGKKATCEPGFTVLQAARSIGVRIGAACESGLCGTCRVMKLSGEVDMAHNGGILDEEIEEGYILACCSRPRGDVEIEA